MLNIFFWPALGKTSPTIFKHFRRVLPLIPPTAVTGIPQEHYYMHYLNKPSLSAVLRINVTG